MNSIKKYSFQATLLALFCLNSTGLFASPQSQEELKKHVQSFVMQQLKAFGNNIEVNDIRIPENLRECSTPLKLSLNNTQKLIGSILVNAKCDSPSWQIYIPAQTKAFAQVVVAGRPINAHATITADDIILQNMDLSRQSGNVLLQKELAIGRITKTNIASGQVIRPEQTHAKSIVERGDKIKVLIESNNLAMSTEGIAQNNAGIGEKVRLKVQSGKIIDGIIKDKSTAIVEF